MCVCVWWCVWCVVSPHPIFLSAYGGVCGVWYPHIRSSYPPDLTPFVFPPMFLAGSRVVWDILLSICFLVSLLMYSQTLATSDPQAAFVYQTAETIFAGHDNVSDGMVASAHSPPAPPHALLNPSRHCVVCVVGQSVGVMNVGVAVYAVSVAFNCALGRAFARRLCPSSPPW